VLKETAPASPSRDVLSKTEAELIVHDNVSVITV
jgi:hypothetical protein